MLKLTHVEFTDRLKKENNFIYKSIKFLEEFKGFNVKIKISTDYGVVYSFPTAMLKWDKIPIKSAVDKKSFWILRAKKEVENSKKIDYKDSNYINNKTKVKLRCKIHDYTYKQRPSHHMSNIEGCPFCAKSTVHYTNENFKTHEEFFRDYQGIFYVVRLSSKKEDFYKIGITGRKETKYRFSPLQKNYDVKVEYVEEGLLEDKFKTEQRFLKEFEGFRYYPKIKFAGYTECLTVNPVAEYYNWFNKYINNEQ